jgi:hypothetical protein
MKEYIIKFNEPLYSGEVIDITSFLDGTYLDKTYPINVGFDSRFPIGECQLDKDEVGIFVKNKKYYEHVDLAFDGHILRKEGKVIKSFSIHSISLVPKEMAPNSEIRRIPDHPEDDGGVESKGL